MYVCAERVRERECVWRVICVISHLCLISPLIANLWFSCFRRAVTAPEEMKMKWVKIFQMQHSVRQAHFLSTCVSPLNR